MARRPPAVVSATMRRVRYRDTSPEVALRKALWARGYRYRLQASRLPGKPDIVFPSRRVAVFVDGDFWHGNQWRLRGLPSLAHQFRETPSAPYWVSKISRNVERDANASAKLTEMGWRVVRCWESQVRNELETCVARVEEAMRK